MCGASCVNHRHKLGSVIRSRIIGTGSYITGREVGNEEIAGPLNLSAEQVYQLTGIRSRHWADEGQATSDLAVEACRRACVAGGKSPSSIDAIVLSTTSPDTAFPSTACYVQRAFGGKSALAFDVAASCSGFLYGLSMADAMIRSGQVRTCLVGAAEIKSRFLDPTDRETTLLFGDGAGAALLTAEDSPVREQSGIMAMRLYADGSGHDLITVPGGGSRAPYRPDTIRSGQHLLRMKGGAVFRMAVRRLERAVTDLLEEWGMSAENIDHVIMHQANARILEAIRRRLNISLDRMHSVIERYGNTSSASLPIALDCAVREAPVRPGEVLLLGAFGGGLTWATGLIRW